MPTRFWQVPPSGLTAPSAILTARRTVCHTAPLRNVVPLLASPPPDTSPTAPKTTPPLCVRLFPYPLLSASQPPANTLLYAVSTSLCSAPRPPARSRSASEKSPEEKTAPGARTLTLSAAHSAPRNRQLSTFAPSKTEAQRSEGRPTDTKKAPAHCADAVSDAPRKAERRRENYFAIPFMIAPETPGAAWYSPNE